MHNDQVGLALYDIIVIRTRLVIEPVDPLDRAPVRTVRELVKKLDQKKGHPKTQNI